MPMYKLQCCMKGYRRKSGKLPLGKSFNVKGRNEMQKTRMLWQLFTRIGRPFASKDLLNLCSLHEAERQDSLSGGQKTSPFLWLLEEPLFVKQPAIVVNDTCEHC